MKHLMIRKLNNISSRMIERLFAKAEELKLPKKDLFVLTSESMIQTRLKSYIQGVRLGENISIRNFIKETQDIVTSLMIVKEELYFI